MRNEPTEVVEYNGYKINIYNDEDAQSPREWDNLGKFALFHSRYDLPNDTDLRAADFDTLAELKQAIIDEYKPEVILPVRMYDHSGISISTASSYPYNDQWDASAIGFIFAEKGSIEKEGFGKRKTKKNLEKITKILQCEVEIYSQYLEGSVYGFTIQKDDDCSDEEGGCWGFFGYDHEKSGLLESAKGEVDATIEQEEEKIAEEERQNKLCEEIMHV